MAALDTQKYDVDMSLNEMCRLADTANIDVVIKTTQKKSSPESGTYFGQGKLQEIADAIAQNQIEVLLVDDELSPMQIRNIEAATGVAPVDRTMLILHIFAAAARTKEGSIQVELAQQKYRLPRLAGAYTAMSRLGGGIGTRGPGETKLETDRRHIQARIRQLNLQLEQIKTHRETIRRARKKSGVPTVALVGYTNVGKSTLLNSLTGAGVLAEDKLFATLDPTARKCTLPSGGQILLVDTVGFVSRLPHHLVNAFQSTLSESVDADLILHLCDIQSPTLLQEMDTTRATLQQLGIKDTPVLTVFNKCDNGTFASLAPSGVGESLCISAKSGYNLPQLLSKIEDMLFKNSVPIDVVLPYTSAHLEQLLRQKGTLQSCQYLPEGIHLVGRCPSDLAHLFQP